MKVRRIAAVATAVVSLAMAAGAPTASAGPIVYSPTYLEYLQLFPRGWALSYCDFMVTVSLSRGGAGGFCSDIIDPYSFYPDGTHGYDAWIIDSSSPVGWSLYRPCDGVPPFAEELWYAYVDGTNYPEWGIEVPPLTDAQVECGIYRWGWWF